MMDEDYKILKEKECYKSLTDSIYIFVGMEADEHEQKIRDFLEIEPYGKSPVKAYLESTKTGHNKSINKIENSDA